MTTGRARWTAQQRRERDEYVKAVQRREARFNRYGWMPLWERTHPVPQPPVRELRTVIKRKEPPMRSRSSWNAPRRVPLTSARHPNSRALTIEALARLREDRLEELAESAASATIRAQIVLERAKKRRSALKRYLSDWVEKSKGLVPLATDVHVMREQSALMSLELQSFDLMCQAADALRDAYATFSGSGLTREQRQEIKEIRDVALRQSMKRIDNTDKAIAKINSRAKELRIRGY